MQVVFEYALFLDEQQTANAPRCLDVHLGLTRTPVAVDASQMTNKYAQYDNDK